ncbi:uroporphyrinogen decarboxylase [Heliobacillus mobilis]|uniref:Uroporphyrinogen decarboxylase n=1 Tax=Heliobacterium mobile TaxID=28064 RepID=A0A6I3SHT4_HELMO|nr:uroporphyrinogen decarboxylase family protein [Heliobacterium mobile]MTV48267.1 uroporphyrinogen decarboxylase [Heliobacterium mobile]
MASDVSMTDKDVVLSTIQGGSPGRRPVALLSGGAWTFRQRGLSLQEALRDPERAAQIIVETNEIVRSDIVWPGSGYHNLAIQAIGGKIKYRVKGTPDVTEPLMGEKIEKIDLSRIRDDENLASLWKMTGIVHKLIGHKTLVGSSTWGPFTLAGLIFGVERLMYSLYKDKAAAHAILKLSTELAVKYLEGYIQAGAKILSVAEPTASGDMISRKHFQEFALPYITQLMAWIRDQGVLTFLHICGNITDRLSLIPESGTDVLSVDFKVDLKHVREKVGNKITFAGNVNPVAVLKDGSPETVFAQGQSCLLEAGEEYPFILMPGCDIPPDTPIYNVVSFINAVKGSK